MRDGTTGVLNVAATCATAGIIVGVVTLTGLAQRFADIIIGYAQGSLLLTAIFTAGIVWIVGLAVPVTASYIMCAVIAAPALIKLGVPDFAAHMFIFYYAVLSEVSPPTALSPFAAAAITGGDPYKTTLQAWKYTMPAFLVPFVFVLDPQGVGLLLEVPKGGSWVDIVEIIAKTGLGIMALAAAAQGWVLGRTTVVEREPADARGIAAGVSEPARGAARKGHACRRGLCGVCRHRDRRRSAGDAVGQAAAGAGDRVIVTLGRAPWTPCAVADTNDPGIVPFDAPVDQVRITSSRQNTGLALAGEAAGLRIFADQSERTIDGPPDVARSSRVSVVQILKDFEKVVASLRRVPGPHAP